MSREELVRELEKDMPIGAESIADWVIADRKRICGPLIKLSDKHIYFGSYDVDALLTYAKDSNEAINQTLSLAGLDK